MKLIQVYITFKDMKGPWKDMTENEMIQKNSDRKMNTWKME